MAAGYTQTGGHVEETEVEVGGAVGATDGVVDGGGTGQS